MRPISGPRGERTASLRGPNRNLEDAPSLKELECPQPHCSTPCQGEITCPEGETCSAFPTNHDFCGQECTGCPVGACVPETTKPCSKGKKCSNLGTNGATRSVTRQLTEQIFHNMKLLSSLCFLPYCGVAVGVCKPAPCSLVCFMQSPLFCVCCHCVPQIHKHRNRIFRQT